MLDILVADDDPDVRESVAFALRGAGHRVIEAFDGEDAVTRMSSQVFDLAICDVSMPRLDGHTLLRRIRRDSPKTSVVMMTTFATVADVIGSMRDGAVNYVAKPFDVDDFMANVVTPLAERRSITRRFEEARTAHVSRLTGSTLVTKSPGMSRLAGQITTLASCDVPVLIAGESGVGKELVARTIHAESARRDGPIVVVDGANLLDTMVKSSWEHLSRARGPRDAWFRSASGGTLVVDGVDVLPPRAQAELLRVIDDPTSRAHRGPSREPRGVRLISLSSEKLGDRVASGEFLDSLYYRVHAVDVRVPPLRERAEDLLPLATELLRELVSPAVVPPSISPRAWTALTRHGFPGNVRELRSALERALALSSGREIDLLHLPLQILEPRS